MCLVMEMFDTIQNANSAEVASMLCCRPAGICSILHQVELKNNQIYVNTQGDSLNQILEKRSWEGDGGWCDAD